MMLFLNKLLNIRPYYLIGLFIFYLPTSFASCTANGVAINVPNFNFNLNSISLYSQIGPEIVSSELTLFTCDAQQYEKNIQVNGGFPGVSVAAYFGQRAIFTTYKPGIGYSLALELTGGSTCGSLPYTIWAGRANMTCRELLGKSVTYKGKIHLIFYKIGTVSNSNGGISISPALSIWERSIDGSYNNVSGQIAITTNSFNVTAYTCSLQSSSVTNINLPKILSSTLPSLNSSTGSTPFNIIINCPTNTRLNITFTDNNNIGQTTNILTPATTSTAKGVGVQLRYNGNIISFGPDSAEPGTTNQIVLNSNLAGVQSFPFTASYIRTGTVTPGTLSSTATFTLSYQ